MIASRVARSLIASQRTFVSRSVLQSYNSFFCTASSKTENDDITSARTFASAGCSPKRLSALKQMGIEGMFPIQDKTFDEVFSGKDVIARAKTGTGKTLAFLVPLIERFKTSFGSGRPVILVLSPTRELALQIEEEAKKIAPELKSVCVYGGASINYQTQMINRGVDIIIGTPGRVAAFVDERKVDFSAVKGFVLDEADRMLDIGFQKELEICMDTMPDDVQTLLFSATLPPWIKSSMKKMRNPVTIDLIGTDRMSVPETVKHLRFNIANPNQRDIVIAALLKKYNTKTIIFTETKLDCQAISSSSVINQFGTTRPIHGDITQQMRQDTLTRFRSGEIQVLVATDVAARGLDIAGVSLVINIQPPRDKESYVHRGGRCGRAGNEGVCVTLVNNNEDHAMIDTIAKFIRVPIVNDELEVPSKRPNIAELIDEVDTTIIKRDLALAEEIYNKKGLQGVAALVHLLHKNYQPASALSGNEKHMTIEFTTDEVDHVIDELAKVNIKLRPRQFTTTCQNTLVVDVNVDEAEKILAVNAKHFTVKEATIVPQVPNVSSEREYRFNDRRGGSRSSGSRDSGYVRRDSGYGGGRDSGYGGRDSGFGGRDSGYVRRDSGYGGGRDSGFGGRNSSFGGRDSGYTKRDSGYGGFGSNDSGYTKRDSGYSKDSGFSGKNLGDKRSSYSEKNYDRSDKKKPIDLNFLF